ncbi:MAG: DMT family transporter [Anaerolineales bacterium]|nr:DMT family transporter [Anaerolineales bacterium]
MKSDHSEPHSASRGYLAALSSSLLLSTTAIFIRYLTETYQLPALVLAFWRDLIVAAALLIVLGVFWRRLLHPGRPNLPYLVVFGIVLAVFNALWTLSVALNGASIATVLVYSSAAFTALLGWWFLRETLDWAKGGSVVFALAGCSLVVGAFGAASAEITLPGVVIGLLSGLGYAVYTMMGRSASQRGINPWTSLLYTFAFASVLLFVVNLVPGGWLPGAASEPSDLFWLGDSLSGWLILIALAAVPTLGGFGLYNVSLVTLSSSVANLVLTTEPVFTVLIAYALLGERLSPPQIAGSLLILTGVVLLRVRERRKAL